MGGDDRQTSIIQKGAEKTFYLSPVFTGSTFYFYILLFITFVKYIKSYVSPM